MIVYEAMDVGLEVRFPNHPYPYALDTEGRLCYVYGAPGMGMVCDITLNDFVKLCEKIPDEQVTLMAMNTALNKVRRL